MLGAELGRNEGQVGDNMADLLFKKRNTTGSYTSMLGSIVLLIRRSSV